MRPFLSYFNAPLAPLNKLRIESVGGTLHTNGSPLVLGNKWRIVNDKGLPIEDKLYDTRYIAIDAAAWLAREPIAGGSTIGEHRTLMEKGEEDVYAIITIENSHSVEDHRLWVRISLCDPSAPPGYRQRRSVDDMHDVSPYDLSRLLQLLAWGLDGKPALVKYVVHADHTLHEYGEGVGHESKYLEYRLFALNYRDSELGHALLHRMRSLTYHLCRPQYKAFYGDRA